MSKTGDEKKSERLIKKAAKELFTPHESISPRKRQMWDEGADRLLARLRKRKKKDS